MKRISMKDKSGKGGNIKATPVKVSIWVDELPSVRRGGALFAVAGVGAIALLTWSGWLAVSLIVNPSSVSWLNNVLPEWGRFTLPGGTSQTLAEIAAQEARLGRALGEPIAAPATQALLLPILETQSRCRGSQTRDTACQQIVELRAYRSNAYRPNSNSDSTKFELIDRLEVTGIEEVMAIAPLRQLGGSRKLPLNSITLIEGKPPDASVWLNLSGELQRGSAAIKYGQVVRYDSQRNRLQALLPWTSPTGQMPHWQQVTGSRKQNELVVNQAVGLEPQFQVYQVRLPRAPGEPLRLEAIVLTETSNQSRYRDGLLLARNGLWSDALKLLTDRGQDGNAIQAQIDFIALHAQVTQAQADRTWASPTQQIAALVIDGRWVKALEALRSARMSGYDIKSLLSANAESLQRRVEAALRVDSDQPVIQQWGAMTVASQRDRSAAAIWLRQHPLHSGAVSSARSPQSIQQILALLDPLTDPSQSDPSQSLANAPSELPRLIGSVSPLASIRASDWYSPRPLVLPDRQVWYQIKVLGFQDGQRWQQSPFNLPNSEKLAWKHLGLTSDSQIQQIGTSEESAQTLSIKAVQWRSGNLHLLAAAPATYPAQPAIALTLPLLAPIDSLTLTSLSQQQPQQIATVLTTLEQQLQQAGQQLPAASVGTPASTQASAPEHPETQALAQIGDWQVDRLELTGEGQPEWVITIRTDNDTADRTVDRTTDHTVIFSSAGALLYSDLSGSEQTIAAIVDVPQGLPALLIHKGQRYQIQQWSRSHQRFE